MKWKEIDRPSTLRKSKQLIISAIAFHRLYKREAPQRTRAQSIILFWLTIITFLTVIKMSVQ